MTIALVLFAKAPAQAKQRLATELGRPAATRIAAALARDALGRGTTSGLAPRYLYWDGPREHPLLIQAMNDEFRLKHQQGNDLGARMRRAFDEVFESHDGALLIGTDCPDLDSARLAAAARELQDHDAVLVPATDGGYVAIGLAHRALDHLDTLFCDIAWGGSDVADATRRRLADSRLSWIETTALEDLDTARDLDRLVRHHAFLAAALRIST